MHSPGQHLYFFDANIWLLILGLVSQPDAKQQKSKRPQIQLKLKTCWNSGHTDPGHVAARRCLMA